MVFDVHLQPTCERGRCPLGLSKPHPVFQPLWQIQRKLLAQCHHLYLHKKPLQFPSRMTVPRNKNNNNVLKGYLQNRVERQIFCFCFSCSVGYPMTECWRAVRSHLYWHWGGGIDKGAPRKSPTCTGISQEGHSSEVWGEHAGSHWGEHPGWAPRDFFGLQTQQSSLFYQSQFKSLTKIQPHSLWGYAFNATPTNHLLIQKFTLDELFQDESPKFGQQQGVLPGQRAQHCPCAHLSPVCLQGRRRGPSTVPVQHP